MYCSIRFHFNDSGAEGDGKQVKIAALRDILEYITTQPDAIIDDVYPKLINMAPKNLASYRCGSCLLCYRLTSQSMSFLLSSFMAAFVFFIFSAQPLVILGAS